VKHYFIFTAKSQRAQRKDTFLLPLGRRQKKKINRYAIFYTLNARRACFLLFSVLSQRKTIKQMTSAVSAALMSDLSGRSSQSEA